MFEIIKHEDIHSFEELERQVWPKTYEFLQKIKKLGKQEKFMQCLEECIWGDYCGKIDEEELNAFISNMTYWLHG